MNAERLQKILARTGTGSRRRAELLIRQGLVAVNGKIAQLGDQAIFGKDAIKVKGKLLLSQGGQAPVYIAFFKPKGVISALSDPENRPTFVNFLPQLKTRVYPVGRLDFNTEGLIFLTNDGRFTESLQKQKDVPRVYHVKVRGVPDAEMLSRLEKGALVGEKRRFVQPHAVSIKEILSKKSLIQIVLIGGGAFDLRALFESRGFLVERIRRHAIGQISVNGLRPGEYKFLRPAQVKAILEQPALSIQKIEKEQTQQKLTPRRQVRIIKNIS